MSILASKPSSSATSLSMKNDFLTVIKGEIRQLQEYLSSAEVFKDKDVQLGNSCTLLSNIESSIFQHETELSSKLKEIKSESQEVIDSVVDVPKSNITSDALLYDITAQVNQLREYLKHIRGLKKYQVDEVHALLTKIRDEIIKHGVGTSSKLLTQELIKNELIQIIKSPSSITSPSIDSVAKDRAPVEIPSSSSATASVIPKSENNDEPVLESSSLPLIEKCFLSHIAGQIDKLQIYLNNTKFLKKEQLDQCFDLLCNLRQTIISHEIDVTFEMQKWKFLKCELPKILGRSDKGDNVPVYFVLEEAS